MDPLEQALKEVNEGNTPAAETTAPVAAEETTAPVAAGETTAPVAAEETTAPVAAGETTAPVATEETTAPVAIEETTAPVASRIDDLSEEDQLKVFNKLTGLNIESSEGIRSMAEVYEKLPEHKKHIELFPKLVDQLKKSKNVLSHFPDETAFKVSQLVLNNPDDYKGKESVISTIIRSDLKDIGDLQVLKLSADLNAPKRVMNPLRSKISSMGLDPDEVINNYDELSDDDKDTIAMAAHQERKSLAGLGSDIEVPETVDDVLTSIEAEAKAAEDDLAERRQKLEPISGNIVNELKEIAVADDYTFKVELSDDEKGELSSILTDTVLSDDIDISSKEGRQELWDIMNDAVWLSQKDKIMKAWGNHIKTKADEDARVKYNNEKPLQREEPVIKAGEKPADPMVKLLEDMVGERK